MSKIIDVMQLPVPQPCACQHPGHDEALCDGVGRYKITVAGNVSVTACAPCARAILGH